MFERFGGKRAILLRLLTPALLRLKGPRQFELPPVATPRRLVFICEGNICRSAYAACYARSRGHEATSFGLRASDGSPAHGMVMSIAARRGIDMKRHRARRFRADEVRPDDLILVFEYFHALEVVGAGGAQCPPVRLLGSVLSPWSLHIHDPYGLSPAYMERCLADIGRAVDRLGARTSAKGSA
jgi:protein-tyrosine phosphatase